MRAAEAGIPVEDGKQENAPRTQSPAKAVQELILGAPPAGGAPPTFGRARSRSVSPGKKQRIGGDDEVVFVGHTPAYVPDSQEVLARSDKKPVFGPIAPGASPLRRRGRRQKEE